jgi:hypothetical protein
MKGTCENDVGSVVSHALAECARNNERLRVKLQKLCAFQAALSKRITCLLHIIATNHYRKITTNERDPSEVSSSMSSRSSELTLAEKQWQKELSQIKTLKLPQFQTKLNQV